AKALTTSGLFRIWAGDFAEAAKTLDAAEEVFGELPDLFDRSESSLCFAARGVLWALREDSPKAEREFTCALKVAQEISRPQQEAIVRALRAVFTADADPARARCDSRWAWR